MNETIVVAVRGVIAFFTLLIFTRALGKQQLSQLTFFDYIMGITIGSIAASLTTDLSSKAWVHWVGLLTWSVLVFILQLVTLNSRYVSKFVDGEPTIVIMNGQIMEEAMKKLRYRISELHEQLREQGVFDISEVEFAVLEKSGKLSVLKKTQHQPVTPKDLNIPTEYKGLSSELIYDGIVVDQNLKQFNLDREWLYKKLKEAGINDVSEVFFATINTQGKLYIDTYKDKVEIPVDLSDYPGPN